MKYIRKYRILIYIIYLSIFIRASLQANNITCRTVMLVQLEMYEIHGIMPYPIRTMTLWLVSIHN